MITENVVSPETIELHDSSSCLVIDGQALVVTLGKADNALTFGDLADAYVRAVLFAGSNNTRIDLGSLLCICQTQGLHQDSSYQIRSPNQASC